MSNAAVTRSAAFIRLLLIVAGALAAQACLAPAESLAASPWSGPELIDHQPPYDAQQPAANRTPLVAVSCPSTSLCVAVDNQGNVATSRDPTAGAFAWKLTHVDSSFNQSLFSPGGLAGLSCPSASLCVAVDGSGNVITSTNPGSGRPTWRLSHVDSATKSPVDQPGGGRPGLSGVSCPTTSFCVAVDTAGDVLTSRKPTTGRSAWKLTRIDALPGFSGLRGVACPTTSMCAAVDDSGNVLTSTNPTGGASAWRRAGVNGPFTLHAVSCPSPSFCVAVANSTVFTSTNPGAGRSAWIKTTVADPSAPRMEGVACPSRSLCVAFDSGGNVLTSTDPTGGASAWTLTHVDDIIGDQFLLAGGYGVSCTTRALCVAFDSDGNVVTSTDPTAGAGAWSVEWIDGSNALSGISCPSRTCIAVDADGNVLTSSDPARGPGTWSVNPVDGAGLSGVSCPSSSLCVAVDGAGDVVTSVAPTAGAHAWTVTNVDGLNALSAVSCPSTSLCVAVDRAGNVVSSTDPGAGAAVWTVTSVDQTVTPSGSAASLVDVSCSSESLCVAADDAGNVVTSTNPTGGASAWTAADIDGTTALTSVACRASRFCIVVDGTEILTSSDPAGGVPAWSATGNGIELSRVWCPSAALCVGGEASGEMATTLDATASAWTTDNIGLRSLTGLACASALLCVAVDANGNAVVGNPAPSARAAQLRALLRRALVPSGRRARIAALLQHGGYAFSLTALSAGRLTIGWYIVPPGAHLARVRRTPILIATATTSFAHAGAAPVKLRLTRRGRARLMGARKLRVTAQGTLTARGTNAVMADSAFVLTR